MEFMIMLAVHIQNPTLLRGYQNTDFTGLIFLVSLIPSFKMTSHIDEGLPHDQTELNSSLVCFDNPSFYYNPVIIQFSEM